MDDDELFGAIIAKLEDSATASVEGFCQSYPTPIDETHIGAKLHRLLTLWNLVSGAEEALFVADIRRRTQERLLAYGKGVRQGMMNLYSEAQAMDKKEGRCDQKG